ncbi:oil body-associated protein 2A-like [Actinidia eriantha]|uniref:oil body-associated protein 2A-like n=1 Tax=Actinidia eriantha TaxID=165200 RepID=UPI00258AB1A8|nr:oil body-associated protein 2A-like [Actinidia eriantha]
MSVKEQLLEKGAAALQSLKPVKQMSQHVCTFALYGHDLTRQTETHHYVTRINPDFLHTTPMTPTVVSSSIVFDWCSTAPRAPNNLSFS